MTIDELKEAIAEARSKEDLSVLSGEALKEAIYREDAREREAFRRYAEESDDEMLRKALLTDEWIPWGCDKVIEFTIGSEKVVFDHETKTIKGPQRLIDEITEANDRWNDIPDPEVEGSNYRMYVPPGDLWNFRALVPLIYRIYRNTKEIKWEITERYPSDPVAELHRKLGWRVDVMY